MKLLGIINVGFDITINYSSNLLHSSDTGEKMGVKLDSTSDIRRLQEFGVPMKLLAVRLIKMCLNEMYSKVPISTHLSDNFPIQNGLKQEDALSPLLFNFALEYAVRKIQSRTFFFFVCCLET
jgi:hypothetical protein